MQRSAPPLSLLILLALMGGTGTVAFQVAAPSIVARTTKGAARVQLNGSIELSRSIAVTAGPPAAGLLVSLAGGSMAFAFSVALVSTAIVAILRLPHIENGEKTRSSIRQQLSEGLQFVVSNPWLKPIVLVSMGFNLGWYMLLGVIVAWANQEIRLSSTEIGIMFAFYGIGMLIGASVLKRFWIDKPQAFLIRLGPYCGFAFAALTGLTMFMRQPMLLFAAFFAVGFGPVIWTITTVGIRQAVTPHHLIGRVSATNMTLSAGARPLGAALGFVVFELGGYPAIFTVAMFIFGLQAIGIGRTVLVRGLVPDTEIEPLPVASIN